MIFISVGTTI